MLLFIMKCSCGPGSNDGCLSGVLYDTDGSSAALRSNPPRRPADKLRNIYTTAPKKGGFGMPWKDMTLRECPPKYYMDVYDGGRLVEKVSRCGCLRTESSRKQQVRIRTCAYPLCHGRSSGAASRSIREKPGQHSRRFLAAQWIFSANTSSPVQAAHTTSFLV